jgi:hypothetical protein
VRRLAILMIAGLLGCGSGSSENMLPGFEPEEPVANGFQVILPIVRDLQPGESYEYCTWTDHIVDHDIDIKAAKGFQSQSGHHVILFYTMAKQPPGTTRLCKDEDMASFRFAVGTGGEGVENIAPGDLVYHIPAGAQIVANHHYLNAGDRTLEAQSAINLRLAEPGAKTVRSGAVAFVDTSLRVPPGSSALDVTCTMNRDMDLWVFSPHMHKWGRRINVDLITGGQPQKLFDLAWEHEYTFHPPEIRKDLSEPFRLKTGDQVLVHCDWDNTTGKDLTFGLEMCVAFGQTINTNNLPNIACDKGNWVEF